MHYAQMIYMLPSVGTYYINILVNVVLVLSTAIVMDGQGYRTIQGNFVNKYINN